MFSSASEHQQCCFLPCSFFFRNKKMPIYCSLLSSPRRLSAQHLTMGGKPRLKETAEEEVEKKKKELEKRGRKGQNATCSETCHCQPRQRGQRQGLPSVNVPSPSGWDKVAPSHGWSPICPEATHS